MDTDPNTPPAEGTPADPPATPPAPAGGVDWEAKYRETLSHSREWEKRAKDNKDAADELAKVKAAAMTEQEKAVAAAHAEGRTAALAETGKRLAAAELRAALGADAAKTLAPVLEAIDVSRFVGDDGEPDTKAIEALAKTLGGTRRTGSSGGDFTGTPDGAAPDLASRIAKAEAAGDWSTARRLKSQLLTTPK